MTVVLEIGCCAVELTGGGFVVTRDGKPVPPRAYPPAVLVFHAKSHARAFAEAISQDDQAEAHRLIQAHGRWYS